MTSLEEAVDIYREQLKAGAVQKAYRGIMEFILDLRTTFQKHHPDYLTSGNIYFGYMDMTYFSCSLKTIRERDMRIAIVFLHEEFTFEAWLAGINKKVQNEYWKTIKESGWQKYPVVDTTKGEDAIIRHVLVEEPDFGDLDALQVLIEAEAEKFIAEIQSFLAEH